MSGLIDQLKSIFKAFFGKNPKEFRVVVLSLIGATTFWLLNALNKNYATTFAYPFEVVYDEEKYIPSTKLPEEIEFRVSGQGWDLFRESVSFSRKPIQYTVKELPGRTLLKSWELEQMFNHQIGTSVDLQKALIDTLGFSFDDKISRSFHLSIDKKSIPVKANHIITKDIEITPAEIQLTGQKKIVSSYPDTIAIRLKDLPVLDEPFNEEFSFSDYFSSNVNGETFNVSIEVEPLIEKTMRVPLKLSFGKKVDTSTFVLPDSREITFLTTESYFKYVDTSDFNFLVHINPESKNDSLFSVQLKEYPPEVFDIQFDTIIKLTRKK